MNVPIGCNQCALDSEILTHCEDCENKSIEKERYACYLNGTIYGVGNLEYMAELFKNYVKTNEMYGNQKCEFKVERIGIRMKPLKEKELNIEKGGYK